MTASRARLLLIDGHSLAFRAYFALPVENFATSTGQATNAVYGFSSMLLSVLGSTEPTHLAVAFDVSRVTFRTALYPAYKGTRGQTPEDFVGQVPLIKELLDTLHVTWVEKPDYEADDILATLATQGQAAGMEVFICSGDRDTFQLVGPDVTVLYPMRGVSDLARMDPAAIEGRYGVGPSQYSDLAALVGESSDNLPGIPGVGPKTAAKWIKQYGGLEQIARQADQIPGKVGQALRENLAQTLLNRRLGQLVRDLDLPVGPPDLAIRPIDIEGLRRLFETLQFGQAMFSRATGGLFPAVDDADAADAVAGDDSGAAGLVARTVELAPGLLRAWLAERAGQELGLDVSGSLARGQGDAWSVAIADPTGETVLLSLADLAAPDEAALAAWLADADAPKVLHESKPAWHMLAGRGLDLAGVTFDVAVAAYLCFPDQRRYGLAELSQRLGGSIAVPADPSGQGMLDLGSQTGGQQADQATGIVALVEPLRRELAQRSAGGLLRDLELPLTPVLARMERAGIAVDAAHMATIASDLDGRVSQAAAQAYDAVGREVNLASPKQLQEILFDQLGMPKTKRIKTGYTTDAEALAELFVKTGHPFLEALLGHRDAIKLRQMVEVLERSVGDDGRIHTTFQQTVAATGRLSSAEPNLQNIPIRTATGRQIRGIFVVGGHYETLMSADYSQIEMRIMAALSGDVDLIEAFRRGEDLHSYVAGQVFGKAPADVEPDERSRIKAMSYGLAYGLSSYGLARQLGVAPGEAAGLMEAYFARFGAIRHYLDSLVDQARQTGYTETIMGRRRYLPDLLSDNRQRREMAERMALNAPIQGSAADIIKVAMLGVERCLRQVGLASRMLLQIHDELLVEVAAGEAEAVEAILRQQMSGAAELAVPLDVSVGQGISWRAAAH